jgi:hypothetical protein
MAGLDARLPKSSIPTPHFDPTTPNPNEEKKKNERRNHSIPLYAIEDEIPLAQLAAPVPPTPQSCVCRESPFILYESRYKLMFFQVFQSP